MLVPFSTAQFSEAVLSTEGGKQDTLLGYRRTLWNLVLNFLALTSEMFCKCLIAHSIFVGVPIV